MDTGLPFLTADLRGVPLLTRAASEDFFVEELPAYPPSGAGDHLFFTIEKRGLGTPDAVHRLARALGVRPRDIGCAGLKDARGVTRQTLSLEHAEADRVRGLRLEGIEVLSVARHGNKLRRGHLRGNRFVLKLRGGAPEREDDVRAVLERLEHEGVPNYFGPQRFGARGDNWRVGRAVLLRDWPGAAALIAGRPSEADNRGVRRARELFDAGDYRGSARAWPRRFRAAARLARAMHRTGGDAERALGSVGKVELRFLASAFQSRLFNRVVGARIEAGSLGRLLDGDLAWRHPSPTGGGGAALFRVEDARREQPRADALEVSASGPLFGRRMSRPDGEPARTEAAVLRDEGLSPEDFERAGHPRWDGGRRPLRVPIAGLRFARGADGRGPFLELGFTLPPGSYATAVLRELAKDAGGAAPARARHAPRHG